MTKISTNSGLKGNQGDDQASKVSSMLQKTAHLCMGQKLAKTKTMDT